MSVIKTAEELDQGDANELLPQKQGEDLVGENVSDNLILEAVDTMDRIRVSFRKTSGAALPHSRDSGCTQSRTSDCRSRGASQRHP